MIEIFPMYVPMYQLKSHEEAYIGVLASPQCASHHGVVVKTVDSICEVRGSIPGKIYFTK